jgi:hypothetical protein
MEDVMADVTENQDNTEVEVKTAWRFFRSELSTIVWDSRPGMNKALADFSKGHFTTEDKAVAKILRDMGYVEIPLDMTEPPAIVVQQPAPQLKTKNVPILKGAGNVTGAAAEQAGQNLMESVMDIPEVQPGQSTGPARVKG